MISLILASVAAVVGVVGFALTFTWRGAIWLALAIPLLVIIWCRGLTAPEADASQSWWTL